MGKQSEQDASGSTVKRALVALRETQAKLDALEKAQREPIAIIGMGCRFPGQVDTPDRFWQLLHHGVDAITEVPPDRWDLTAYYDPNPEMPGKMYSRYGGFLDRVDLFDPQFFGISPREAASLDPQQRLLLEVAWEALENANQAPDNLFGSNTGVFVGITGFDYVRSHLTQGLERIDAYFGTGITLSVAAGRLSYILGLTGPSMSVDTACSSSLVTTHLACQSLRQGECDMALAGGVNVILAPEVSVNFSKARMMAPDGRCKAFDASANGYVRSEGCGVLVLKRLSDARRDGDNILAVIRGSAVNQDGPSGGLTVPNGLSQQRVIRQALANGGVEPEQVSYIEAHGTGTSLGDPIEAEALAAVFGASHTNDEPLRLGSVKTNVGHLEGAAGMASLIKVVLALQHQEIPASLHLQTPNPYVNWESMPLLIPTSSTPWSPKGKTKIAGVSSFGFSGTNAHIILEEAPPQESKPAADERPLHLLTLSAKKAEALPALAIRYQQYLAANPEVALGDVCHTANTSRSHFHHRLGVTAVSAAELQQKLEAFANGHPAQGVSNGQVHRAQGQSPVVFLFTGQGAQYVGMGQALYQSSSAFRQTVDECAALLQPHLPAPLLEVLFTTDPADNRLHQTVFTQPALFVLEYALARLWQAWGIQPAAVMGHSIGEYVAACIAGAISLEEALTLVAKRAQLMQALPHAEGAMAVIFADEQRVEAAIQSYSQDVSIAAVNGPGNIVISGQRLALTQIIADLEAENVSATMLKVSHAFHSPLMEPMLTAFAETAGQTVWQPLRLPLVSNLTGQVLPRGHKLDAHYWQQHTRKAVQFRKGIDTLFAQNYRLFLEVGPKPVLLTLGKGCHPEEEAIWLPTLVAGQPDWRSIFDTLAQLYTNGATVNWDAVDKDYVYQKVILPTYPFQRRRYWIEGEEVLMNTKSVIEPVQRRPIPAALPARQQQITQIVRTVVADLLHLESEEIDTGTFLMEMGADSLILLEAIRAIEQHFGIRVTVRRLVEELTTIDALAAYLDKELPAAWVPAATEMQPESGTASFNLETCFYQMNWENQPADGPAVMAAGHWLILADAAGLGQQVAAHLQTKGHTSTVLAATMTTELLPSLQQALQDEKRPLQGILYLWAYEPVPTTVDTLTSTCAQHLMACLQIIQTVSAVEGHLVPHLWLVTCGAQPTALDTTSLPLMQTTLWGLGRTCAVEHPECWGGLIDLDPLSVPDTAAAQIVETLFASDREDQVMFRSGVRYVPRLARTPLPAAQPLPVRPDSSYLISGGHKGVGFAVSRWLAQKGAKHLVLLGRTPLPARADWSALPANTPAFELAGRIQELERWGAAVHYAAVDVAEETAVADFMHQWQAGNNPAIRGVIHCASVWQDDQGHSLIRTLARLDAQAITAVLRPKVLGSWLLHQHLAQMPLDFCIFFSSGASLIGSAGQGNYAAANAFLDGLATARRAMGQPGLSLNWGAIADVGFGGTAEGQQVHRHWESRGIGRIPAAQVPAALEQALATQLPQVGILHMDWQRMKQTYPHLRQAAWASQLLSPPPTPASAASARVPQPNRQLLIQSKITAVISNLLQLPTSEIDIHLPFLEMGADSIVLIDATRLIETAYGLQIAIRQLFEELTTIEAMSIYIDQHLSPDWVDPTAPAVASDAKPANGAAPLAATAVTSHAAPPPAVPIYAAPLPASVPASPAPAALHQAVTSSSGNLGETAVERIMREQLQVMSQQLALLSGGQTAQPAVPAPRPLALPQNGPALPGRPAVSASLPAATPPTASNGNASAPAAAATLPPWRVAEVRARGLTPRQQRHLEALIGRYTSRTQKSKAYAQTHRPILADNRASAGFRFSTKEMLYPIVGQQSQGSRIWDIDGNEYIDITMGFGVHFFGHNPPFITAAIENQLHSGIQLGPQSHLAGEVARLIGQLTGMERVAFCNSGTEAVMTALRLARTATGRHKIALFSGSYHGHFDGTLGMPQGGDEQYQAMPIAPGTPAGMLSDVLVLDYGEPRSLEILQAHADDLAAVLVEPVQSRRPDLQPKAFLQQLRQLTRQTGTVLIFDEMITGFRIHPGGAQAWFGVSADLATYGKIVGAGLPIGVVAGKAAIMDSLDGGQWQYGDASYPQADTTFFAGTFCKNPLTIAAAHAALTHLQAHSPALQDVVNQRTEHLAQTLNTFFTSEDVPIRVVHFGSLFRFAFNRNLDLLFYHLLEKGVFIWEGRNYFLSTAHTDEDVDYLIQAVKDSVEELRAGGFLPDKPGPEGAIVGAEDAPVKVISRPFPQTSFTPPAPTARVANGHSAPANGTGAPQKAFWGWRQPNQTAKYGRQTGKTDIIPARRPTNDVQFSLYYFGSYEAEYREDKYDLLIEGARYADAHGFTAVWAPERHFHSFGGFSPNPSVIGAALARETKHIQLRAGSVVLPLHHPIRIAEEWAVVDNLSKGRVGVSFASGWHPNDFVFAPQAFGNHKELMFEGIEIVQALWRGESITVPSGSGKEVNVNIFPAPVQPELPIWITVVNNPDTYRRAGEMGAAILTNLMGQSIEDLGRNIQLYRETLAQNGFDPASGHITLLLHTYVGSDLAQVREEARQPFYNYLLSSMGIFKSLIKSQGLEIDLDRMTDDDRDYLLSMAYQRYVESTALIGTPASCAPIMDNLLAIGVDEIACFIDFGVDTESVLNNLPHLNTLRQQFQDQKQRSKATAVSGNGAVKKANQNGRAPTAPPIIASAPLTEGQKQLWVLSQMGENGSLAGYPSLSIQLQGPLQLQAMRQAIQVVVDRHEALRTTIDQDGTQQHILGTLALTVPLVDLTAMDADESASTRIAEWLEQDSKAPFDLVTGPLIRVNILRLAPEQHVLIITTHHIINDGFSIGVLLQEISHIYSALCQNQPHDLALPMQYREYIAAVEQLKQSGEMAQHEAYWLQKYADFVPVLNLPLDRPRPPIKTFAGGRFTSQIDSEFSQQIMKASGKQGCTLLMTLLATYMTLLHRLSGQDDIVVGIPAAVRWFEGSENIVGYCTNLLPIRSSIANHPTFAAYLKTFRSHLLEDYEHLAYPIITLTEKLKLWRDVSTSPFVSAIFNLERRIRIPDMHNLETSWFPQPISSAGFELDLNVTRIEDGKLVLEWNYNKDIFDEATIIRWDNHYHTLLRGIVREPEAEIGALPLLTAAEQQQMVSWNQTELAMPETATLPALFQQQAARTPQAIAVQADGHRLTYQELEEKANQLAHYLQAAGVGPDSLVAVCLSRSVHLLVALLGVLKAGGAYLPLDPTYPTDRLAFMLGDAQATLLLTEASLAATLTDLVSGRPCLQLDADEAQMAPYPTTAPATALCPENLAYVIYTSGSTGQPKGAMITHRGLANYLLWANQAYAAPAGNSGGSLVHSSIGFDATITSLFVPLLAGQTVHLLSDDAPLPALQDALATAPPFHLLKITPAHLEMLNQLLPAEPRPEPLTLVIGGEALPAATVAFWRTYWPQARLVNEYGPTETVVGCCVHEVSAATALTASVPIGRPIANTQLYLLDAALRPVPVGVVGELYIGGQGVARGYLRRPQMTAVAFLPDPFSSQPGARLYRTGDLARYLPDGSLLFLGRRDTQVKLRGFRIELGEIEAALNTLPAVSEAVVCLREDRPGDKRLVAYLVTAADTTPTPAEWHQTLRASLPEYMLPTAFVCLPQLPLTENGKVDRQALPAPDATALALSVAFVPPSTPTQITLAAIWAEVLNLSQVGIHDNFFHLGGHSLLATQVISRVREAFQVELPLPAIFEAHTVAIMAEVIAAAQVDQVEEDALAQILAEVNELSDEEVMQQLLTEDKN